MFAHQARRSPAITLAEDLFTHEEEARIQKLRHQFLNCPDSFKLDVNYRRMDFARWLVERGRLDEGIEGRREACTGACARREATG